MKSGGQRTDTRRHPLPSCRSVAEKLTLCLSLCRHVLVASYKSGVGRPARAFDARYPEPDIDAPCSLEELFEALLLSRCEPGVDTTDSAYVSRLDRASVRFHNGRNVGGSGSRRNGRSFLFRRCDDRCGSYNLGLRRHSLLSYGVCHRRVNSRSWCGRHRKLNRLRRSLGDISARVTLDNRVFFLLAHWPLG